MASQALCNGHSFSWGPAAGLEIPFASSQGILAALDIQAEAAHVEEPQGNVELG